MHYKFLLVCLTVVLFSCQSSSNKNINWDNYLGDKNSNHYSVAEQIKPDNVDQLEVAWVYNTGDVDPENRSQIQCNPLIIDGILYGSTPQLKFFAINAATGEELWKFNPFSSAYDMFGMGLNRGLAFWKDQNEKRILVTAGSDLFAINADSGELIETFGNKGKVDLHDGLGADFSDKFISGNTPGIIYKNLLILGARVSEGTGAAPGHIRAYNVLTGKQEWIFHTIPHPGEIGHDTWPADNWEKMGGANNWSGLSLDEERGIVYVPTGSASYDFYGADRPGQNLFANTLLALNAETGERIWHYQTVHHDIWDRDLPAPPNLVTLNKDGKKIDAVAQITKSAFIFIFDRATGEPYFPIEEKAFPSSDLPGEKAWPTQPIPTKPSPFSRQILNKEDLTDIDEESNQYVSNIFDGIRSNGQFIPPSKEGTVIFPGYDGGGEWGGSAVDPETGILYINASEMPWILTMVPVTQNSGNNAYELGSGLYTQHCGGCHGLDRKGGDFMGKVPGLLDLKERLKEEDISSILENGKGGMPSFKFLQEGQRKALVAFLLDEKETTIDEGVDQSESNETTYVSTGYNRFTDQNNYPAVKPPWGTLTAIDLNNGETLWKVPLGEYPELIEKGLPITGTENYGGPTVTKSGLLFIGATKDEMFRAFDTKTGKLLWKTTLPAGGYATPSTYTINGKQFVVIACGGGKMGTKSGGSYVAFALPDQQ